MQLDRRNELKAYRKPLPAITILFTQNTEHFQLAEYVQSQFVFALNSDCSVFPALPEHDIWIS